MSLSASGSRAEGVLEQGRGKGAHSESQPVTPAGWKAKQSKAGWLGEQSDITCERAGRGDTESEPPELENTTEPQSITKPSKLTLTEKKAFNGLNQVQI